MVIFFINFSVETKHWCCRPIQKICALIKQSQKVKYFPVSGPLQPGGRKELGGRKDLPERLVRSDDGRIVLSIVQWLKCEYVRSDNWIQWSKIGETGVLILFLNTDFSVF
jgi:hypothetical protein